MCFSAHYQEEGWCWSSGEYLPHVCKALRAHKKVKSVGWEKIHANLIKDPFLEYIENYQINNL